MILKNKEINDKVLESLNKYVLNDTGYEVQFIIKPMTEGYKITDEELMPYNEEIYIIKNDSCLFHFVMGFVCYLICFGNWWHYFPAFLTT